MHASGGDQFGGGESGGRGRRGSAADAGIRRNDSRPRTAAGAPGGRGAAVCGREIWPRGIRTASGRNCDRLWRKAWTLSEPMLRDAGFAVEKEIGADLPLVVADPAAVSKCMENLVSNAVKYRGRTNRWRCGRARAGNGAAHRSADQRGRQGDRNLLPRTWRIFSSRFTACRAVRDGQIRGVGLGLYLVKQMMEGMGGRVSVSSELGARDIFYVALSGGGAFRRSTEGRLAQRGGNSALRATRHGMSRDGHEDIDCRR